MSRPSSHPEASPARDAHDHGHGHGHGHDHGHGLAASPGHDHAHGHAASPGHDHDHAASPGHDHAHGHAASPGHDHDHAASPGHDHGHDHAASPVRGHDHGHSHGHADRVAPVRLGIVLALQFAYMLVELGGGWWTGSLALVADAGHMATDVTALGMVLVAARIAARPATPTQTWGWRRAEVLAALANAAALFAVGGGIVVEALSRFGEPHDVAAPTMMGIAAGGLFVNLAGMAALGSPGHGDLNARGAWLHLLSDALGSVGAIVAGAVMWKLGWMWADPAVSLLVSALVLRSAWGLMRDAAAVLMESAPPHVDVDAVREALLAEPGVLAVHDLHVWMIAWGDVSISAHVVLDPLRCADAPGVLHRLSERVRRRTGVGHITLQLEPEGFIEDPVHP